MTDWQTESVVGWLLRDGRMIGDLTRLTEALGERLLEAGAPLSRLRVSMRILHPLFTATSAVWQSGGRPTTDAVAVHGLEQRSGYLGSPLAQVGRTGRPFRRRLERGLDDSDHSVLHALAAEGATDYLALPMPLASGHSATMVAATDRAGGFEDPDLAKLEEIASLLCLLVEALAAHRLARTIVDAYIGPRSGRRVLDGQIRRGDVETLRAAIWFSDLRGWSRLANSLPAAEAVALANGYFELVESAVNEAGGEILKLIGDAVLAVFPADGEGGGEQAACRNAVEAALAAQRRAVETESPLRFGVGLHLGELIYGNVGTPTRLDFTVMGQAVNLAARLEGLTKTLERPVVVSEALAQTVDVACCDLGLHPIPGWDEPVRGFAPES